MLTFFLYLLHPQKEVGWEAGGGLAHSTAQGSQGDAAAGGGIRVETPDPGDPKQPLELLIAPRSRL